MANYTYKCRTCEAVVNLSISIAKFQELSDSSYFESMFCDKCSDNAKFMRIFGKTSSKITKDKETLMAEIKEDARKMSDEVRAGNKETIRQIYGEDI
tara:strand:- start:254 stop:544 length:291 start_codon:yes stop_codon:yes gene_type:complete